MRLIDADKLLKFFTVDTANQTYRFGTVKKQIESAPTVNAIPLDKIKQAREEIKECSFTTTLHSDDYFMGIDKVEFVRLDIVCKILDKLITESED